MTDAPSNFRRTFAIISHPDAGKTTLTEKLLLYGGALHLAGSVTARKNQRATASDWMELEKKRGISISSTALQFQYEGFHLNLLDTPGHRDFSEDTYRVLTAVDSVIMVIDAAKGIEAQTRKLFEVCRRRSAPIFTFINKLDHPTREPLELLDEIENILHIRAYPMNWPLGVGMDFKGVFDRREKRVHLYERTLGGMHEAPVSVHDISDEFVRKTLDERNYLKVAEELEMLDHAGAVFDSKEVLAGRVTPAFFGSALNNFGVRLLLDGFMAYSPPPGPRRSGENLISPSDPRFSGFIFKIQGNMDPRHRDRVAFMRVCSGKFTRDMAVFHSRSGKKVKLNHSHKLFGRDREILEEAYAGDIVGLVGHSDFGIGDTLTEDSSIAYSEVPRFPPECFAYLHNPQPAKYKAFRKGLEQFIHEGIVQIFTLKNSSQMSPLMAAVGPLQFEVVQYRLESEYGAAARLENGPWTAARWTDTSVSLETLSSLSLPSGINVAEDADGRSLLLFPNDWSLQYFEKRFPEIKLHDLPPAATSSVPFSPSQK